MEEIKKVSDETQKAIDKLSESAKNYDIILEGLNRRIKDMRDNGQTASEHYTLVTDILEKYNKKIADTSKNLDFLNVKLASENRIEVWGKRLDGAKDKIQKLSKATESMGEILGESAKGLKPFADNLKTATNVAEPLKTGITKVSQAYVTFKEGMASGKGSLKSLWGAVKGLTGGFKAFKIALAETGVGIIIIAVAALIEKLKTFKPLLDKVNAAVAAAGAVFNTLGTFLMHPIEEFKGLGKAMKDAAKNAYDLSLAQDKLKTSLSVQEVANDAAKAQIDLLKEQSENTKSTYEQRKVYLQKAQKLELDNYDQNKKLTDSARANAIEDARIKGKLNSKELARLRKDGTMYAAELLESGRIDQDRFDAVKKADQDLIKLKSEQHSSAKAFAESNEKLDDEAALKRKEKDDAAQKHQEEKKAKASAERIKQINEKKDAEKETTASQARMAESLLSAFSKEIKSTEQHFAELKTKYAAHKDTVEQLKKEEATALAAIRQKFEEEDAKKLDGYHQKLTQLATEFTFSAKEKALSAIQQETEDKLAQLDEQEKAIRKKRNDLESLSLTQLAEGKLKESEETLAAMRREDNYLITGGLTRQAIIKDQARKEKEIKDSADKEIEAKHQEKSQEGIDKARGTGHESSALKQEIELLDRRYKLAKEAAEKEGKDTTLIKAKHDKDKADLEDKLLKSRIHAGDKLIDAVMKNTKKDSAVFKAAFIAKKATAIADTIISTKQSIMESLKAYSGIPFIGQALGIAQAAFMAVQGATSIAEIAKQKPAMARGGQFISDGRGAVLPGYSRTDDTNAYLRSGEAVVVSEAMRNPWARNLVSAINVAHGGRDFSVPNGGRGYAIGGIFTDGGNANRYYSAPVNDQKDLANTLAYQMINNFPPIYVDVKDVNNQQNILAQTVNRVTL